MDIGAPQPSFAQDGERLWLAYRTHRGDQFTVLRFEGVHDFWFGDTSDERLASHPLASRTGALGGRRRSEGGPVSKLCRLSNRAWIVVTLALPQFSLEGQEPGQAPTSSPRCGRDVHWVGVAFLTPTTAIAVGSAGALRSTDAGASWQTVPIATSRRLTAISRLRDPGHGAVLEMDSVLLTSDGGATWTSRPALGSTLGEYLLAVFLGDARTGPAVGTIVGTRGTTLRTTDGGATWTNLVSGLPDALKRASGPPTNLTSVFFTDVETGTAVGTLGTILWTVDGGTTWTRQVSGTSSSLVGVVFTDAETGFAVGMEGTILHTTDAGVTWTPRASGTTRMFHAVGFANLRVGMAVGDTGTIVRTTDGGATWSAVASGTLSRLRGLAFADSQIGVVVGEDRAILRTTDGGATWTLVSGRTAEAAAMDPRLVEASGRGRPEQVVALLRAGAGPDATDREGYRPALVAAAARGDTAIVRILLDAGADVDKSEGGFNTALTHAAGEGHTPTVRMLLERGANVRCGGGGQLGALGSAARLGYEEIVRLLLAHGVRPDRLVLEWALIAYPRRAAHVAIVTALLEAGAPVNERDRTGQTPLMLAVGAGASAEARVLIAHGADIAADIGYARAHGLADLAMRLERLSRTAGRATPPRPTPADSLRALEELIRRVEAEGEDELGDLHPPDATPVIEEVERARASLAARLLGHPQDVAALILWARIARHDSLAASYAALDRALELEPRNPEAHYWKGRLRGEPTMTEDSLGTQRQNLEDAVGHLRTAVELAPQNVAYRRTLAVCLVDQGKAGEARTVMSAVTGGENLLLLLLSDVEALPIPDGTLLRAGLDAYVYGVGSLEALGRIGRTDQPRLRLRVYRLSMNAAAVEAFYRSHWPGFRFVPMDDEGEKGSREYVQYLRRTRGGFEPLAGGARMPGQPTEGIFMMLVDEGEHPEGSGAARSYLVLTNYRK